MSTSSISKFVTCFCACLILLLLIAVGSCRKHGLLEPTPIDVNHNNGLKAGNGLVSKRPIPEIAVLLAQLDALEKPAQTDSQIWVSMKAEMREWLTATFGSKKKNTSKYPLPPAGPPTPNYVKPRDVEWVHDSENPYGTLTWRYANDGDYNQDGLVSVPDMTLIAMHLNELASEENSIQGFIDEDNSVNPDGNGVVDYRPGNPIADDMDTIYSNFYVDIACYEVLGSNDQQTWNTADTVNFSEGTTPPGERTKFVWSIPNSDYRYYKIRALSTTPGSLPPPDGPEFWWCSDYNNPTTTIEDNGSFPMPLPVILKVSPLKVHPGVPVEFNARINSDEFPGTISSYDWQFNVRGAPYYFDIANPEITFPITEDQRYEVYAQVRVASQFGYSDPRPYYYFTVVVTKDGIPPSIVSVTPPSVDGEDGDEVSFEAVVDGDPPFTYAWDFDDGATPNTSSSATPIVNLANPGEHPLARLTVTNAYGSAFVNIPLTVHGWITTPIDTSGNLNYGMTPYISLAHSNCGESGISYQTDRKNLKYARRIGGEWLEPEDVDLFVEDLLNGIRIYVGTNNSLAFNPSPLDPEMAEPSIAYEYAIEEWDEIHQIWTGVSGAGGVRYASWSQNDWVVHDGVVVNSDGADPSLAYLGATPYISWYHDLSNCDLYLSHETSPLPWDSLIIDDGFPTSGTGLDSSLAIDSSGNWCIAYRGIVMTPDPPPPAPPVPNPVELRLARHTDLLEPPTVVDESVGGGIAFDNSIALTPGDKVWIAYQNNQDWSTILKVARELPDSSAWVLGPIALENGLSDSPSLDIDTTGTAGLTYCWRDHGYGRALKYVENINGSWEEPVTFDVDASACSFSFTPEGKPGIAYVADGNLYYTELF